MIPKARGLDISRWQGSFCAEKARAAGVSTVILRAACNSMKKHKKGSVIL